jgi:competence protein ComEA
MRRIATVLLCLCLAATPVLAHLSTVDPGREAAAGAPLDLNQATVEQLDGLPGIGPALAARIIAHRDEHGPFERIEQLGDVKGIGARTLEKLRPRLVLQ